jgi:hypothetical protein
MWHVWVRREVHTGFWWGYLRGEDYLEDLGVDVTMILKLIFMKWDGGGAWTGYASGQGQVAGCCECGNERSGSIKCGEFLD